MQRFYETIFIARQDITANQVEALAKQYTNVIKEFDGEVTKTEFCGLRNLAYKIKKNRKGHYVLMNIAVKSDGIKEMERQMKINEDVLRYLSIEHSMNARTSQGGTAEVRTLEQIIYFDHYLQEIK